MTGVEIELEWERKRISKLEKALDEAHRQIGALKWELGWRPGPTGDLVPPTPYVDASNRGTGR